MIAGPAGALSEDGSRYDIVTLTERLRFRKEPGIFPSPAPARRSDNARSPALILPLPRAPRARALGRRS